MMGARPQARLKIDDILRGDKTNVRVVGMLLFREWDEKDKRFYYWEEWEVTGLYEYDTWIEYDHYERRVSLYEPVHFKQPIDPETLHKGQKITVRNQYGTDTTLNVSESGVGQIISIRGKNTYQVFEGEMMSYATLSDSSVAADRRLITVEKYNNREFDMYRKIELSDAKQKSMFGRLIRPYNYESLIVALSYIILFVSIVILALFSDDGSGSGSRSVHGGGIGGFGK